MVGFLYGLLLKGWDVIGVIYYFGWRWVKVEHKCISSQE